MLLSFNKSSISALTAPIYQSISIGYSRKLEFLIATSGSIAVCVTDHLSVCIIGQIGPCIGGNLNILIWAWSACPYAQVGRL